MSLIEDLGRFGFSPGPLLWINGFLFTLCCFMSWFIGQYVINNWRRRDTGTGLAIGLWAYVTGDMLLRLGTWVWRIGVLRGQRPAWLQDAPIPLAGAIVAMVGGLCIVRELWPRRFGWVIWVGCAVVCTTVATLSLWLATPK